MARDNKDTQELTERRDHEEPRDKHHKSFAELAETLKEELTKVDKRVKPTGQLETPARTCAELFKTWKHLPSGDYFIDPNEGSPADAILANCNKETKETCVKTDNLEVKNNNNNDDNNIDDNIDYYDDYETILTTATTEEFLV